MKYNRIMISAPGSGSGKTMVTCGLAMCLKKRGKKTVSFKCGPDYIDPMFHKQVLGIPSENLDLFFSDGETVKALFASRMEKAEVAIIEGAMGYYDGAKLDDVTYSAYELSLVLKTPVILVVDAKGMGYSLAALCEGIVGFRKDAPIEGIILNRISSSLCARFKPIIEERVGIPVLGCLPQMSENTFESRHLGLFAPSEIADVTKKIERIAAVMEESIDIDRLLRIVEGASELKIPMDVLNHAPVVGKPVKVAVAMDEAFSFYYEDNLRLLTSFGAHIEPFSPLHDKNLPQGTDALLLGGGYPELYLEELSKNTQMKSAIKEAVTGGMPLIAECGGFLYLMDRVTDIKNEKSYEMAGMISGEATNTGKLTRFGYETIESIKDIKGIENIKREKRDQTGTESIKKDLSGIHAHEFHYYDTTNNGDAMIARKPFSERQMPCMHVTEHMVCGFPHLYYRSKPDFAKWFVKEAAHYREMHHDD